MGPDPGGKILEFPTSTRGTDDSPLARGAPPDAGTGPPSTDELAEVDHIFAVRSMGLSRSDERRAEVDTERTRLQDAFSALCTSTVRPAMQAFLERLQINGGGGLLEEHAGVHGAGVAARIRLWMSLSGELIGRPRQDQHPYLQLDLDVAAQHVNIVEGDIWRGHGTSGPVGAWAVSEITGTMVTQLLMGVLRRAAS